MKGVKKRSVPEGAGPVQGQEGTVIASTTAAPSLSENVNLFQSLRVLQEGETDEERNSSERYSPEKGKKEF